MSYTQLCIPKEILEEIAARFEDEPLTGINPDPTPEESESFLRGYLTAIHELSGRLLDGLV